MLNTEELKKLLDNNHNIVYGRAYLNIINKKEKIAVIDDNYQIPIILIHCYNYTETETENLKEHFNSFFYHKLPEFHMGNKIVLMFLDTAKFVRFLSDMEGESNAE